MQIIHAPRIFKKLSSKYNTPLKVQKLITSFKYNKKDTVYSALQVWNKKTCHCFEASFFAAAILENCGYPPLVLSLESSDNLDHVVFVFKYKGKWGAIGKSRDEGLHGRKPVFRSIRDLMWSFFDEYIDKTGRITAYQLAHLDFTKTNWRFSKKNLFKAENYLIKLKHKKIKSSHKRYKKLHAYYLKHGTHPRKNYWW